MEHPDPRDFRYFIGKRTRAAVGGAVVLVGNRRLMDQLGLDPSAMDAEAERLSPQGKTVTYPELFTEGFEGGGVDPVWSSYLKTHLL